MGSDRRKGGTARGAPVALVLIIASTLLAGPGVGQDYRQVLGMNLDVASGFLAEASDALSDCNDSLLDCFRFPEETVARIDAANEGLSGVIANLSALEPPAEDAETHALLLQGFDKVVSGLALYSQSLRDRTPDTLSDAVELIQEGKADIEEATRAFRSTGAPSTELITVLTIVVTVAAGGMAVLFVLLLRRLHHERMDEVHRTLATCPECGEVLDRWWTFRRGQIRAWQRDHLKSHQRDEEGPLSPERHP